MPQTESEILRFCVQLEKMFRSGQFKKIIWLCYTNKTGVLQTVSVTVGFLGE